MRTINIREMAHILNRLACGETFDFYMNHNETTDSLEEAYGLTRIKIFDADMIVLNYYGGGSPYIIDITSVDNQLQTLQEGIKEYFDYVGGDCAYLKDEDNYRCLTKDCIYWHGNGNCAKEKVTIACGECCEYEKKPLSPESYEKMTELPELNEIVFVTLNETFFHEADFLGYGAYGTDPKHKTFCVRLIKDGQCRVDFFDGVYKKVQEETNA